MTTLTEVPGLVNLSPSWRAACVILCGAFPNDREVWAGVIPGVTIQINDDEWRPYADRVLLAAAQSLIDPHTMVTLGVLADLDDARLRLVLDALAIARGGLPID